MNSMNENNQIIFDFLNYYRNLNYAPEYAVLIKGPWGTGKTWFIDKFIKSCKEQSVKILHISLYGMSSFNEIEDEFFRLLHPKLSSKKMLLAGKIAKSLLKTTLKIDLNGDGENDGSISSSIPDIDLPSYLTDSNDFILIFDDIERCSIPINSLLGYINHFVEHDGQKVILVANEDEILQREGSDSLNQYARFKEKLIGKTLQVTPEVEAAFNYFISVYSPVNKLFIENYRLQIIELYHLSEYKNLRHVKQALADFERLLDLLPKEAKSIDRLIQTLLTNYLIFAFETKSGNLKTKEIRNITSKNWTIYFLNESEGDEQNRALVEIIKKYPGFNAYDLLLSNELWEQIFDKGVFEASSFVREIESSKYLFTESTPIWKKLWYASELDDDEILRLLAIVGEDVDNFRYKDVVVFLHIFGIFLFLSDCEIYQFSRLNILNKGKSYIDKLKTDGELITQSKVLDNPFSRESAHSLGFHERDSTEFNAILEYIHLKISESSIEHYPIFGKELLGLMVDDTTKFVERLMLSNSKENIFYNIPVLAHIEVKDFIINFIELSQNDKWAVTSMLSKRYGFDSHNKVLLDERPWLVSVSKGLKLEGEKFPNSMKKKNLTDASRKFDEAANLFNFMAKPS